jgi:hypothetical protein
MFMKADWTSFIEWGDGFGGEVGDFAYFGVTDSLYFYL